MDYKKKKLPSNSNGRCNGKSTRLNLVWSGNAKSNGSCTVGDNVSS